jgi:hypothetical protein
MNNNENKKEDGILVYEIFTKFPLQLIVHQHKPRADDLI